MKVYCGDIVSKLGVFYAHEINTRVQFASVAKHLDAMANRMFEGLIQHNEAVLAEISNYHPDHLGKSKGELQQLNLSLSDCQKTIANEYGFADWHTVIAQLDPYDFEFEACVDLILAGNLRLLKATISNNRRLLNQTSQYGHQATLLHYCASNGVEFWRQKVPYNLVEIVSYLLKEGANKNAKMKVYGGEHTTIQLLTTSIHPYKAGLTKEVESLLVD